MFLFLIMSFQQLEVTYSWSLFYTIIPSQPVPLPVEAAYVLVRKPLPTRKRCQHSSTHYHPRQPSMQLFQVVFSSCVTVQPAPCPD